MKWEGNRESSNVEDQRGSGGGGGGFGLGGRSIGIGTVVLALIGWGVFGINPLTTIGVLSGGGSPAPTQQGPAKAPPANDQGAKFVSTVLASTEDVWSDIFTKGAPSTVRPVWGCLPASRAPPAAPANRRWGRSTAPATRRSTWTWISSTP